MIIVKIKSPINAYSKKCVLQVIKAIETISVKVAHHFLTRLSKYRSLTPSFSNLHLLLLSKLSTRAEQKPPNLSWGHVFILHFSENYNKCKTPILEVVFFESSHVMPCNYFNSHLHIIQNTYTPRDKLTWIATWLLSPTIRIDLGNIIDYLYTSMYNKNKCNLN